MENGIEARRVAAGYMIGPARSQSAEDFLAAWRVEISAKDERTVVEKVKKPIAGAALEIQRASVVRPGEMRRGDSEAQAVEGDVDRCHRVAVGAKACLFR